MTELAHYDPFDTAPAVATSSVVARHQQHATNLREWLDLFTGTAQAANALAKTDFVPTAFRDKPASVAAAIMQGHEMGVSPIDALQNMYVVHGKVGFSAEFMRRRILNAGHEYRIVESTNTRCILEGRRAGTDEWQRASFTADQAKTAKIDIGSYPADKLMARASSRLCRQIFPDVLGGAAIVEDLEDSLGTTTVEVGAPIKRAPAKPAKPLKAAQPIAAPEEPDLPENEAQQSPPAAATTASAPEPDLNEAPGESVAMSTYAQQQQIAIALVHVGATSKEQKLARLEAQFGRTFTSAKELTADEATTLLAVLEQEKKDKIAGGAK